MMDLFEFTSINQTNQRDKQHKRQHHTNPNGRTCVTHSKAIEIPQETNRLTEKPVRKRREVTTEEEKSDGTK